MMARAIPNEAGHSGVVALEGPPWMRTTIGYFLPDSTRAGGRSHPWMSNPSLVHSRFSALPQLGDRAILFLLADAIHQLIRSKFQAAFRCCCEPPPAFCHPLER